MDNFLTGFLLVFLTKPSPMKPLKRILLLLPFLFCSVSCKTDKEPDFDNDFIDRAISLATKHPEGKYIELPDLYDTPVNYIPENNDENFLITEKLKIRGFKTTGITRNDYQLLGRRVITMTLLKDDCQCEVSKVYYMTSNISEYIRSERIKCETLQK
jgi:hypothetical protein